ncbi:hypothetical protein AnigIFM59636_005377 [Aspergillus niger]|nr:hypothetical protein AnigIFM59636_005377 [Aspergillus niger]
MPIQIYENERVLRLVDPDDPLGKSSRDSGSNREVTSSGLMGTKGKKRTQLRIIKPHYLLKGFAFIKNYTKNLSSAA